MSRLTDALEMLRAKCTPNGVSPEGNNVDEIVECMAHHFTGGSADWNANEGEDGYIKNRTHYEKVEVNNEPLNITWDGNTEGLLYVDSMKSYKVSDIVLTHEDIKKLTFTNTDGDVTNATDYWDEANAWGMITDEIVGLNVVTFVLRDGAEMFGKVIPEAGIYIAKMSDMLYVSSINSTEAVEQTRTLLHKIDLKYLPKGIGCEEVKEVPTPIFYIVSGEPSFSMGTYVYTCNTDTVPFVVGDKYKLVIDSVEIEGVATADDTVVMGDNTVFTRFSGGYQYTTSYEVLQNGPCLMSLFHYETQKVVHKMDSRCLPNVADLDAQWLADLKAALGIS